MRRVRIVAVNASMCLIVLVLLVTGCSTGGSPKNVVSKFVDERLHGNYNKSYQLLSAADKAVKSVQQFGADSEGYGGLVKALSGRSSYIVKDIQITEDRAIATVDVTIPDVSGATSNLMGVTMRAIATGGKPDDKEIEKIVAEKFKGKNILSVTRSDLYSLVKEKDGWRIYMGWSHWNKIKETTGEAKTLEKQKKYSEAKSKYLEMQALSPSDMSVVQNIKDIDDKIDKFKVIQEYFPNIEINTPRIGKGNLDEKSLFGEVKNKGGRTLKRLEITMYFLDKVGKAVDEKSFDPVSISEYSHGKDNPPVKPNESKKFGYKISDAPADWSGKYSLMVTNLEFE